MNSFSNEFPDHDPSHQLSARATLYRLIDKGILDKYLWTDGKKKYLELNPKGKKSLAQIIATNIQWRSHALHVKN